MRTRRLRWSAMAVACATTVGGSSSPATADDLGGDIPLDAFRPALDARGFVTVDGGEVLEAGAPSFGLVTTWSRGLLELAGDGAHYRVDDVVSPTLVAAIGLPGPLRLELAGALPFGVIAADRGPDSDGGTPTDPSDDDRGHRGGQGVGDAQISAKLRLVERDRWVMAAATTLSLPTATAGRWLGTGAVGGAVRGIIEWRGDRLRLAANLGLRLRAGGDVVYRDDAIMMGVSSTGETVTLGAAAVPGGVAASWSIAPGTIDLLGEVAGQLSLGGDYHPIEATAALRVRLAAASHFTLGAGTGLGGGAGNPELRAFAAILFEPGAATHKSALVIVPPELPAAPPPGDRDDDQIDDNLDDCPDDREDFDEFEDGDGCPDPDNDRDRILDLDDLCPDHPEDYDEIEDDDGCPETDRGRVSVGETQLDVFEDVLFEFDRAVIREESYDILGVVAQTLALNADITLVEIGGHTDDRGSADYNLWLSQQRAESVRTFLVDQGVDADRLEAQGYGETMPKKKGRGEKVWTTNRRVEFLILRRAITSQDGV